jgi:hypothetical protein
VRPPLLKLKHLQNKLVLAVFHTRNVSTYLSVLTENAPQIAARKEDRTRAAHTAYAGFFPKMKIGRANNKLVRSAAKSAFADFPVHGALAWTHKTFFHCSASFCQINWDL